MIDSLKELRDGATGAQRERASEWVVHCLCGIETERVIDRGDDVGRSNGQAGRQRAADEAKTKNPAPGEERGVSLSGHEAAFMRHRLGRF